MMASSWCAEPAVSSAATWWRTFFARATVGYARSTSSRSDEWYQRFPGVENLASICRSWGTAETALRDATIVYNLAADMGGMGFIENNRPCACCRC